MEAKRCSVIMRWAWYCLFTTLFFISVSIQAQTLRLTSGEYAPFITQTMPDGGPITEIVMQAAQEANIEISLGYFPWHQSMNLAQQIDLALGNIDVLKRVIAQEMAPNQTQKFAHHPRPIRITPLYILFSRQIKQNYDQADRFNKALRRLKADGRYQMIWSHFRQAHYNH